MYVCTVCVCVCVCICVTYTICLHTPYSIVKHVLLWIQLGGHELVTNPLFLDFSERLQDSLLTDGFVQQIKDIKRVMKAYANHPTYNIVHSNSKSQSPGSSPIFKGKSVDMPSIIGAVKSVSLDIHMDMYMYTHSPLQSHTQIPCYAF